MEANSSTDSLPLFPYFPPNGGVNLYLPYSLLLGYDYGSGNGSISRSSDHGFITDASTYGVRLDYAVAANLNAYATFLYASRVSQGYGWGWIRPDPAQTSFLLRCNTGITGHQSNLDPQDGNILDLSFRDRCSQHSGERPWVRNWRRDRLETYRRIHVDGQGGLLEARRLVQVRMCGQETIILGRPERGNRWGINPNREIDPIFGMRVVLQVNF